MSNEQGWSLDEAANYHAQGAVAPEGFDPNATGWQRPPVGEHVMEIVGSETRLVGNHACRWEGQEYCLHQLRPKLRIVEGPHAGATITDFIHIPTVDEATGGFRTMAAGQANKWANFLRGFGIPCPKDQLWPPGFTLGQLAGRKAKVQIVPKMKDGVQVVGRDGMPEVEVKFFGYSPLPGGTQPASTPAPAARSAPAAGVTVPPTAPSSTAPDATTPTLQAAGAPAGGFDL